MRAATSSENSDERVTVILVYKPGSRTKHHQGELVNINVANCLINNKVLKATVRRIYPESEKGRTWEFCAHYDQEFLVGHYYADTDDSRNGRGAFWLQHQTTTKDRYLGYYVRANNGESYLYNRTRHELYEVDWLPCPKDMDVDKYAAELYDAKRFESLHISR